MRTLRLFTLAIGFVLLGKISSAQWVSIPDTNFGKWLSLNGYTQCLQGNSTAGWQMDTTCQAVTTVKLISFGDKDLYDLTGIQYFDSLNHLDCKENNLTWLPPLPPKLSFFDCGDQFGTSNQNGLDSLPALPLGITSLHCRGNRLTWLPTLPATLSNLDCSNNQLTSLPALPTVLRFISCTGNNITALPALPTGLQFLYIYGNNIGGTVQMPDSLRYFVAAGNNMTGLSSPLPPNLFFFDFSFNNISYCPPLPPNLYLFNCGNNPMDSLPVLPNGLQKFFCTGAGLTKLPDSLPTALEDLRCTYNPLITAMPPLPATLKSLQCTGTGITALPELPDTLTVLEVDDCPIMCLPQLKYVASLRFNGTGVTCLPNYPSGNTSSVPPLNSVPLCDYFNPSGCPVFWNITGTAYIDSNNNCALDMVDAATDKIKVQLWNNGTLEQQVYTTTDGSYSINTDSLTTYQLSVDTTNLPLRVLCPVSGSHTSTLTTADSLDFSLDFALECKPGYDLEARSIATEQVFRPANYTEVEISAGDATNFYNANCAAGVSGTVSLLLTGPITFISSAPGGVTPNVTGDTLTWPIADFGTVNFFEDFDIIVQTDTLAQMGQYACFILKVNPIAGDNKPINNTLIYCFTIVNSYDPNDKQAYPAGNIDTAQEELTYTVRFQNTGNADAQHIYITDTLDANVRPETFELLAYSHQPGVQIDGRAVRFNFPNINLPDSFSNEPGSHGFVQYKVKLKDNLPVGTVINNTAFIYFDFNPPVITNTATNTVSLETGIRTVTVNAEMDMYPNPANGAVTITVSDNMPGATVVITDVLGRRALEPVTLNNTRTTTINTHQLPEGVYLVNVSSKNGASVTKRLVINR